MGQVPALLELRRKFQSLQSLQIAVTILLGPPTFQKLKEMILADNAPLNQGAPQIKHIPNPGLLEDVLPAGQHFGTPVPRKG